MGFTRALFSEGFKSGGLLSPREDHPPAGAAVLIAEYGICAFIRREIGMYMLLRAYFDAFFNLYGITPLYRAFRIIQKQNPELELTEEEFLSFVNEVEQEEHFYIIADAEEIYSDVDQPTRPLKREIIAEYLFAADDFESYDKLKTEQDGKPFYIPEKESLLKYQDDRYEEETKESMALGAFLRDKLKLKKADDVLSDLQIVARMGDNDPQMIIWTVERLAGKGCLGPIKKVNEFFQYSRRS